ncbi:MAG: hypothetical protein OQK46_06625 [Gammaproteobacteria bacterium]|nr:hypothetical protein [Gammaproteobacteria bacterium]
MRKISSLLASLPLITTACGGGGSDSSTSSFPSDNSTLDLSQYKGIWSDSSVQTYTSPSGNKTTYQPSTGLITSQEDLIILTSNSDLYIVKSDTGKAYYFKSFAYLTEMTSSTAKQLNNYFVLNYYNVKRDAGEQVSLPSSAHYNSPVDFDLLTGVWDDTYHSFDNWSFDIRTGGIFTATKSGLCEGEGTLSPIDASKRELAVSITFNNNCGSNLKGTHTGYAWPDEGAPDNTLNIAVYSSLDASGKAIGWKINKQ